MVNINTSAFHERRKETKTHEADSYRDHLYSILSTNSKSLSLTLCNHGAMKEIVETDGLSNEKDQFKLLSSSITIKFILLSKLTQSNYEYIAFETE